MELCPHALSFSKMVLQNGGIKTMIKNSIYKIFYIKQGELRISIGNQEFCAGQGQLLFLPPRGSSVVCQYIGKPCCAYILGFQAFPNINAWEYPPQVIPIDADIQQALDDLPMDAPRDSMTLLWKFYRLLSFLQPRLVFSTHKKAKTIQPAIDYMSMHDDYSTDQLAELCGISRSSFCSAFREVTGESVVEARHRIQAFKASMLLYHTDLSVEEIAARVGFSSVKHFRSVFQMRYHTTPLKHRQQYRSQT